MHSIGTPDHAWSRAGLDVDTCMGNVKTGLYAMSSASSSITSQMKQPLRQDPRLGLAKWLAIEEVDPISKQGGSPRQGLLTIRVERCG